MLEASKVVEVLDMVRVCIHFEGPAHRISLCMKGPVNERRRRHGDDSWASDLSN
jgi:hypothetical protein